MEEHSITSNLEIRKEAVVFFLSKNILLSKTFFSSFQPENINLIYSLLLKKVDLKSFLYFNEELKEILPVVNFMNINWFEFEKARVLLEKYNQDNTYKKFVEYLKQKEDIKKLSKAINYDYNKQAPVKIIFSYEEEPKKRDIQDFTSLFNKRFQAIEAILKNRQELQNLTSINKILSKKEKEVVSLIGIVFEIQYTKNGNLMITAEDLTGNIKLFINKNSEDLYKKAKDIVLDEIIGVSGVNGENIVFVNDIIWPDVPVSKELKKSPDEVYALFLSDLHIGSKNFLEKNFQKFLRWTNGLIGTKEQREIAKKVRYIFIIGDLIDGCGVYPEQDKELLIKDIYEQYEICANLLSEIPFYIRIIIIPGNHDALRISEPQPALYKDFAKSIWELPNAILLSNPSYINIHSQKDFPGFDILLYHGYSFDYYVANVDSIRNKGGYDRADLIMKFLLQRRHLAPAHKSTLYIPETKKDPLVIEKIPDFFITGHIHKSSVSNYRNITLICGSCWQSKTAFQEKMGHNPEPCRVPIVNLQTRAIKILRF